MSTALPLLPLRAPPFTASLSNYASSGSCARSADPPEPTAPCAALKKSGWLRPRRSSELNPHIDALQACRSRLPTPHRLTAPEPLPPHPPPYPRSACRGPKTGRPSTPTAAPPQTRPKCTPRHLKSFLEKTLIAREGPISAPPPARPLTPPFASCSVTMPAHDPA